MLRAARIQCAAWPRGEVPDGFHDPVESEVPALLLLADGAISYDEALERTRLEQLRYAKRQLTWFKAMPEVEWLPFPPDADAVAARIA